MHTKAELELYMLSGQNCTEENLIGSGALTVPDFTSVETIVSINFWSANFSFYECQIT